jgi:F-box-like
MPEFGCLSLPAEVLLNVFEYLDGRDLVRCLRVSKNSPPSS